MYSNRTRAEPSPLGVIPKRKASSNLVVHHASVEIVFNPTFEMELYHIFDMIADRAYVAISKLQANQSIVDT